MLIAGVKINGQRQGVAIRHGKLCTVGKYTGRTFQGEFALFEQPFIDLKFRHPPVISAKGIDPCMEKTFHKTLLLLKMLWLHQHPFNPGDPLSWQHNYPYYLSDS